MASLGSAYVTIRGDIAGLKTDLNKAMDQIKGIETKTDAATRSMSSSFGKVESAIKTMSVAMGAFAAAAGALAVAKDFLDAGIAAEMMGKKLQAATGSLESAGNAQKFLRTESERLGLVFMDQVKTYSSLAAAARGTTMEGKETEKIFTAVASASTALGLSADETSGALRAIQQMMSKGNVQAEELRGQLGERLPGAFNMAAEAMGVTTKQLNKMLEQGEVLASDLLPKLADVLINKYGAAATEAADLTQANINRMKTAWTDLKVTIIEEFMPAISSGVEGLTNLIRLLPNLSAAVTLARTGLIDFKDIVFANGEELNALVNNFDPVTKKIAELKNKIDEISSSPMSWAYQDQLANLRSELKALEDQQEASKKKSTAAITEVSKSLNDYYDNHIKRESDSIQIYVDGSKTKVKAIGDVAKAVKNYADTVDEVFGEFPASSISAFDDLSMQWAKITLSATEYEKLSLAKWFSDEAEKVGEDNTMLRKLYDTKLLILQANAEYAKAPLPMDSWLAFEKGKVEASERSDKEIADASKKSSDTLAKDLESIYDGMWKNIQSEFADTLYGMFENGLDSWDDFFDSILDLFKKMIAQMAAAMISAEIASWFGFGTGFSFDKFFGGSGGTSVTGVASTGLSLASGWDTLTGWATKAGEALGMLTPAAEGSTAALEALMAYEVPAETAAGGAGALSGTAGVLGAAAATAAVMYFVGSGAFESSVRSLFGYGSGKGNTIEEIEEMLRQEEAGLISMTEEVKNYYKMAVLGVIEMSDATIEYIAGASRGTQEYNAIMEEFSDRFETNQAALLNMTMAQYDYLKAQQAAFEEMSREEGSLNQWGGFDYDYDKEAVIKLATEIAADATLPIEQKMYQLGFIATETGWESDATIAMLAEFKDGGVPWDTINQTLIDYGLFEGDVYKRIYAEYHGERYVGLGTWEDMQAAMLESGVDSETVKTIKTLYDSNIPWDQFVDYLKFYNVDSETLMKVSSTIDPSEEWKDLVIPVDAPDSIPLELPDAYGRASGGPVAGGNPYIIGEKGMELFIPQESGHIISNANLMKMGIKGYADGTTEWPLDANGLPTIPSASGGDQSGSDWGFVTEPLYATLEEWSEAYAEEFAKMMGTTDDLAQKINSLNEFYKEQVQTASDLGASSETIAQLYADQEAIQKQYIDEFISSEIDYYNERMGLANDLSDSLSEIKAHYDVAIASAEAAGMSEENLAALRQASADVTSKAIEDWKASELSYYEEKMGIDTSLRDSLSEVKAHYEEAMLAAQAAGASEDELAALRQASADVQNKMLTDVAKEYQKQVNAYKGIAENPLAEIEQWFLDYYELLEAAGLMTTELLAKLLEDLAAATSEYGRGLAESYISKVNGWLDIPEDKLAEVDDYFLDMYNKLLLFWKGTIPDDIMALLLADYKKVKDYVAGKLDNGGLGGDGNEDNWDILKRDRENYDKLRSGLISSLEDAIQELADTLDALADKMEEVKYSKFNLNVGVAGRQKAAEEDYQKLLKDAQTGDPDAIAKYMAFVNTYLQASLDRYKSSDMYQHIYDQVMKDMGGLQKRVQDEVDGYKELLKQVERMNHYSEKNWEELSKINATLNKMLAEAPTIAAYSPRETSANMTGYNDPEIKSLLKGILAAQGGKQNVVLKLDSGKTLTGELQAVADKVYVTRAGRTAMESRRMYN